MRDPTVDIIRECRKIVSGLRSKVTAVRTREVNRRELLDAISGGVVAYFQDDREIVGDYFGDTAVLERLDELMRDLLSLTHRRTPRVRYLLTLAEINKEWGSIELAAVRNYGKKPRTAQDALRTEPSTSIDHSAGEDTTARPRLFVGSSSEALHLAYALQENLERDAEVTVWTQGIFSLSRDSLDDLLRALDRFDAAVFVFAPDDAVQLRSKEYNAVRDNVILEFGLFCGRLGREYVYFVTPRSVVDFRLPSDLLGVTPAMYDCNRRDQNWKASLGPAANQIRHCLASRMARPLAAASARSA